MMRIDLAAIAKQRKIQYFFISYVDLFGGLRAKLVPARAIGEMQENGAGFAGFAVFDAVFVWFAGFFFLNAFLLY